MMDETGGQDQQAAPGWEPIVGGSQETTPKAWDSIVPKEHPQANTIGYLFQQGAKEDPARAAKVVRFAGKYKMPEPFVSRNLDTLEEQDQKHALDSEDLINTNPSVAKMVMESGPAFAAVALKHLPTLQKLNMLYTRPPQLWPKSDSASLEEATKLVDSTLDQDWEAYLKPPTTGYQFGPPSTSRAISSKKEFRDISIHREYEARKEEEAFIGGSGPIGAGETFSRTQATNPAWFVPWMPTLTRIGKGMLLDEAKAAYQKSEATPKQIDLLNRSSRLDQATQFRKTGMTGYLAGAGTGAASMIPEFMMGGAAGRTVAGAFGLGSKAAGFGQKLLSAFVESGAGAATAGLPAAVETYFQRASPSGSLGMDNKGNVVYQVTGSNNEPQYVAIPKAALSSFADYFGAHLLGPWFSKASPEIQSIAKQSLLKTFPMEGLKMVGMNEASAFIKGIGGVTTLEKPTALKAFSDPEAAKEVFSQFLLGGSLGAFHAGARNAEVDSYHKALGDFVDAQAKNAQLTAEGALRRAGLLHESKLSEEIPEASKNLSEAMAKGGPNEFTYLPSKTFGEYFTGRGLDARSEGLKLVDGEQYDHAVRTGTDLTVPTALYDHAIGKDPEASKFFGNELRSAPDMMNVREATEWQKRLQERQAAPSNAREDIIRQIVEQSRSDKAKESVLRARLDQGSESLLVDPATLGLSDKQVTRISEVVARGQAQAEGIINAKEQNRRDKLKGDLYAKEEARTRELVSKEVDAKPEYQVLADLQNGTLKGKLWPKDQGAPPKISREALKKDFPGVSLSDLPKGITNSSVSEGVGIHPEDLAAMHGYKSGHDFLYALMGLDRAKAIEGEVKARMDAKYPNTMAPSTLPEEAVKALHNEHSAELKRLALQYIVENKLLPKMMGVATRRPPTMESVRYTAKAAIAGMTEGRINPQSFLIAERAAAKEAVDFAAKGDWEATFDAKLRELHAHESYRAAQEAIDKIDKTYRDWGRLEDLPALNKPYGIEWKQQIQDLLRRIGLIAVDPRELSGKKPITEWAKEKYDNGETRMQPIAIDPKFASDSFATHHGDLTYGDILSLNDTIEQMTYLAKELHKVKVGANKISIESLATDIVDTVSKNFKKRSPEQLTSGSKTVLEKALHLARWADASLDRPEEFFKRLDGGRIDGPISESLWHPQVEARVKYADLRRRFAEEIKKANQQMPKELARRLDDRISLPGVQIPVTMREIMAMVANGGNESSYSKMIRGEEIRGVGLTHELIQEAAKRLPEEAKDHVQKLIDITNSFWPEVEALHKWATGLPPKKIEAKQMIEAMGNRPGGYYPAMYDKRYSKVGEIQVSGELGRLLEPSWRSATTDAGYRQERVEAFAAPMDFDFMRLATHIDSMAKDIAFRPWLMDANKIVNNPDVKDALRDHLGSEYREFMNSWLKRVVNADNHSSDSSNSFWRSLMGTTRHNVTVATLALKPGVFLHHALGIGPAIAEVGGVNFMKAYGEFLSNPHSTYETMKAESPEMAHYLDTFDTNIRESLERLGSKTSVFADVQRLGMKTIAYGNLLRVVPTYYAAKAKAIAELSARMSGAELESYAIKSAERAVRITSGSGNPGDVPAIMKSDGMKMLLMFYTPGSILYARTKTAISDFKRTGDMSKLLFQGFWLLPAAAALHTIVSGHIPDDQKDETYLGMAAKDMATYPFSALPMGHEIAQKTMDAVSGKSHDMSISSPVFKALEHTFDTIKKSERWYQDEAEFDEVARQMFKTAGYWVGAPTDQVELSAGYLYDLATGKSGNPNDIFEFTHDLLWRRPKERR